MKIGPFDLAPLLDAKDPDVRLQAVAFLGELRPRDEASRKMPRA